MSRSQDSVDKLVSRFVQSYEGIALNTAFLRIEDARLRRHIVELAREAAKPAVAPKQVA